MTNEEIFKLLKEKLPNLYKIIVTENDVIFYWTKSCNDPCSIKEYKIGTTTYHCFLMAGELDNGVYVLR